MFPITFEIGMIAIAQIFAMGAVGYVLVRKGVIHEAGLKLLSFISINIAFPLFIFYQITEHFYPRETPGWWAYPFINIGLILLGLLVASLVFRGRLKVNKDEFLAVSSMHNAGYIPLLLALSLPLGASAGKVYTTVILSIIGFDICLWSLGVWLMTRQQNPRMEFKNLLNPPLISMAGATLFVLVAGHGAIPAQVLKPIKTMGDSAMALAMIVIGGNLGLANLKRVNVPLVASAAAIKVLVVPAIVLLVLTRVQYDPILELVILMQACMPTAISLSIIGRHYSAPNQDFVNQTIFVSHLACMVTLPVFLSLFVRMY